jgi:hypothetical protein
MNPLTSSRGRGHCSSSNSLATIAGVRVGTDIQSQIPKEVTVIQLFATSLFNTHRFGSMTQGRLRGSARSHSGSLLGAGLVKASSCGLLVLGLFLAQVGPSGAATIRLSAAIEPTTGAFDYDFFPQVGLRVECSPSCFSQSSRTNAVAASILSTTLGGRQNFGDASMFVDMSGRARVGDLGLSVSSFAGAGATRSWASAQGGMEASWLDVITITTNAVPLGEQIFLEASLNLAGTLGTLASGQGRASAAVFVSDLGAASLLPSPYGGALWGRSEVDLALGTSIHQPLVGVLPVRMTLTNGARVPLGYLMSLGASGMSDADSDVISASPGSMNADAIAINSLHWGGIQRVTDRFGNALGHFTVESDSGFDFSQPFASSVPEPSKMALMLAALLAWWGIRRRR